MSADHLTSLAEHPKIPEYPEKLSARGCSEVGTQNVSYARRDRFHREFRPHIEPALSHGMPMKDRQVIEIGCGAGSVTHAFTEMFAELCAFEIDPTMVELATERRVSYALDRLEINHMPPDDVVPAADAAVKRGAVFRLHAV